MERNEPLNMVVVGKHVKHFGLLWNLVVEIQPLKLLRFNCLLPFQHQPRVRWGRGGMAKPGGKGVLFGWLNPVAKVSFLAVLLKTNRRPWFTWWFNHLPGPSIFQKGHLCLVDYAWAGCFAEGLS